jgi:hypothetical protein
MSDARCPMCSKNNPAELEECRYCGARLKPLFVSPHEPGGDTVTPGERPIPQDTSELESSLPDWLRDLRGQDNEFPHDPEDEHRPEWKDELTGSISSDIVEGDGEQETAPDWLAQLQSHAFDSGDDSESTDDQGIEYSSEYPHLSDQEQQFEPVESERQPEEGVPDWLSMLSSSQFSPEDKEDLEEGQGAHERLSGQKATPFADDTVKSEGVPDWLSELGSLEEIPAEKQPPDERENAFSSTEEDLPSWLSKLDTVPPEKPTSDAVPAMILSDEDDLISEQDPALESDFEANELGAIPDWLSQVSGEETDSTSPHPEEGEPEGDLTRAELPTWLEAMRPVESAAPTSTFHDPQDQSAEKSGPLAGLRNILPAEPEFVNLKKPPVYSIKLQVSENQMAHMALLEKMLETEAEAKPIPERPLVSSQFLLRILIAVVLISTILAIKIMDINLVPLPPNPSLGISEAKGLIDRLPPNAAVLVAVDYEPGFSGEMNASAAAVIEYLIAKDPHLTLVSTHLTGPVQGEHLLMQVNQDRLAPYINYVHLGYLPGGAAGLRGFAHNPKQIMPFSLNQFMYIEDAYGSIWEKEPLHKINTVADFDMLLVLTENPHTARAWIEQVEPVLSNGGSSFLMVVSAQAAPLVMPYFENSPRQVDAVISGLEGGAAFGKEIGQYGRPASYWDAFGVGLAIAILFMGLGGMISIILALVVKSRRTENEGTL